MPQRNYFLLGSVFKQGIAVPTGRPYSGYSYKFCMGKTKTAA